MELWISFILNAATSLRGASNIMAIVASFFNLPIRTPTWHTGRLWLMRLGYYKLHKLKEQADDWIWIIDHSVQIGVEKTLVILGVRQSNLPDRPLRFDDVEPIELIPVKKSNGEIVYQQLEAAAKKTGIPKQVVSDHGPDIKTGIEKFCGMHNVCFTYDVKHKMASILKRELEQSDSWQKFLTKAAQTKKLIQQTELAPLMPPAQRTKARFMNIDKLVYWGLEILKFCKKKDEAISNQYNIDKIKEKISWIFDFENKLDEWNNILSITMSAESFVRHKGLGTEGYKELEESFSSSEFSPQVNKVKNEVLDFIKLESLKVPAKERLLGSSEIIESVFGKQKFIEKDQSKSGFTGLLLALPAFISKTSSTIIKEAMGFASVKKIIDWQKNSIGKSVQATRIESLKSAGI